jgi:hypothetical protein
MAPPDPEALPAPSRLEPSPALPDPFRRFDGTPVETPAEWRERRAELEGLFRHYVYGYAPDAPRIDVDVDGRGRTLGGDATLREATISFPDLPPEAPSIHLALVRPRTDDDVPVVLGLNREGNHATVADEAVTVAPAASRFGSAGRGERADAWCVDYLVERGYGFATFHCADVDPDRDDFSDGVHPVYDDGALPGPAGSEWGTLAAWAWGLQRCVDHLHSADGVRSEEIAVLGHSRRGKAALLAGATDERIGLVVPHQSGTGGVALSRDNGQETVASITENFPHWFADTFHAFGGRPERLPVDQHLLVAMVAPRPLLDTAGARDYWLNPGRSLDALRAAAPVYDHLGARGLVGDGLLYEGDEITAETAGRLLQYRRETEHTLELGYWEAILDFADLHFDRD